MRNRGQIPAPKWIAGFVLTFSAILVYGTMSGLVETKLPALGTTLNVGQHAVETIDLVKTTWWYGIIIFAVAGLFYVLIGFLIGQEEEEYI